MKWTYMGGFCDLLLEHMGKGFSFESFAGTLKYPNSVVNEWLITKPTFAETKKVGESLRRKYLEGLLLYGDIDLKTFQYLVETPESEIDNAVSQFDDTVLVQAKQRFMK